MTLAKSSFTFVEGVTTNTSRCASFTRNDSRLSRANSARASLFCASRTRANSAAPDDADSATTSTEPSHDGATRLLPYSSSTAWKLLPPKPNELTAASLGPRDEDSHGRATVGNANGLESIFSAGLGLSILMVGGMTRWCSANAALRSPAAPAAALVWPTCDFTEPSAHHGASSEAARYTCSSAVNSAASPALVPVPCASSIEMSRGVTFASRYAACSARA